MNERLKQLRKALGKRQEEMAELLGVTYSAISSIESGRRNVTEQHLKILEGSSLNVNIDWLRTGEGEMFLPKKKDDRLIEWMAENFDDRDPTVQHVLLSVLSSFDDATWTGINRALHEHGDIIMRYLGTKNTPDD